MKVLIVEDEPLLRQGLVNKIDWRGLQLQLVGEAADGVEALELLPDRRPDIVLTDVRMPGMNGLQFIGRARDVYPDMKFVVISGYNEFEYARQAMKFSVKDYLLKPVDARKLHELLAELCNELRAERRSRRALDEAGRLLRSGELSAADYVLTRFAAAGGSGEELPAALLDRRRYMVAAVKLDRRQRDGRHSGGLNGGGGRARLAVHRACERALAAGAPGSATADAPHMAGASVVFRHVHHADELVVLHGCDEPDGGRRFAAALERLIDRSHRQFGIVLSIGVSRELETAAQLPDGYLQAARMARNRIFGGDGGLFGVETAAPPAAGEGAPDERLLPALAGLLDEGKHDEFAARAEEALQAIAAAAGDRYGRFEAACLDMLRLIRDSRRRLGGRNGEEERDDSAAALARIADWREALGLIRDSLAGAARLRERLPAEQSCERIVDAVRCHIERHYDRPLSLQWVSETFYIHPNYFSTRFRQLTGCSFSDYVTRVRMERAKELLRETSLKISRVAQLVGYDDQNYFCKVFRKSIGLNPTVYRKRSQA